MKALFIILTLLCSFNAIADDEIKLLKKLVEIPSGTNDLAGVNKVQTTFNDELKSLGFKTDIIPYPEAKLGPMWIATLKGKSNDTITMLVHADTVFEKSSPFKTFTLEEGALTATGPGIIDDKGGMVVLLAGLKDYLKLNPFPKYTLRIVSTSAEEAGMPLFIPDFKKISEDSILVLGFEPCLDDGSIINSRRGNRWYEIKVTGREAHAGRSHKEGINACWELAKKLDQIAKLTNYKKDLTVSIGHIEGGQNKFNIVCGEATAKIDVRFSTLEAREQAHKQITKIVATNTVKAVSDGDKSISSFEIIDDTPPFAATPSAKGKIELLKKLIARHENIKVTAKQSGGAADTNYFSRPNLPIIDGLGACGGKMHTPEEFLKISSLKTRAKVLSDFLESL